jgi:hypothetical protein
MSPPIDIDGSEIQKATIDGQNVNQVTIDGQELFVGKTDSVVHRWTYSEGGGITVADSVGGADGTRNGWSWITGTWVDGAAGSADGVDDFTETTTLGTFGSDMANDFAVALTFQTSTAQDAAFLGVSNSGDDTFLLVHMGTSVSNGSPGLFLRDMGGGNVNFATDSVFSDGSKKRLVLNKITNDPNNWEIHINGSEVPASVERDQGFSNPTDFDAPVYHFARNESGVDRPFEGELDDVILANESLSSTEIQDDYDRQPWS